MYVCSHHSSIPQSPSLNHLQSVNQQQHPAPTTIYNDRSEKHMPYIHTYIHTYIICREDVSTCSGNESDDNTTSTHGAPVPGQGDHLIGRFESGEN